MNEETKVKTKNTKGLIAIIIAIILLIAIIGGAIYYLSICSKTETILKKAIDNSINAYQKAIQEDEYETIDTKIGADLKLDIEEDNDEYTKVVDFINALDLQLNVQMDRENKQVVAKLESNYENDELLNADAYIDVEDGTLYMYLKDMFDKSIEFDIKDQIDEMGEDVTEMFSKTYTKENKENLKKSSEIIKNELKNIVKTEYCSNEKEEITINGQNTKVTKNTISMTYEQLSDELIKLFTNLKDNQEFINCYENKEEVTDYLDELIKDLEHQKDSYEDTIINISLYTTGIMQKFVKLDIQVEDDSKNVAKVEIIKNSQDNYDFIASDEENKEIVKLNIKSINSNESTCTIEINVPDTGKMTLNLNISYKINEAIDQIDTRNSIKEEDLTDEDRETLMNNFSESKLYEVMSELMGELYGGYNSSVLPDLNEQNEEIQRQMEEYENNVNRMLEDTDSYDEEDEFDYEQYDDAFEDEDDEEDEMM